MRKRGYAKKNNTINRHVFIVGFISVFIGLSVLFPANMMAQGDLLIIPRRVVFEGKKRSQEINLANSGNDTATYAISIVQMRMKEDGGFEAIDQPDSGQNFADKNIRYFPRKVTLGPKEAQTVKLQLTRTDQLTPGEYRSHIYFRAEPKRKPLGEKEEVIDTTAITVRIVPVFGITIPVIIRWGECEAKVALSDLTLGMVKDTIPRLKMALNRTGNISVYGDITVDYISPQGKTQVGIAKGVSVYTPNTVRQFQLDLDNSKGINYRTGKLHIVYSDETDNKSVKLAEGEILLY